jgi:hypothetical protein
MDWEKFGYKMLDAVWLAQKYPSAFKIPGVLSTDALRPNDFVKIFFEDQMMPEFPERLWVQVGTWDLNYGGTGRIANVPYCISATYGDTVMFKSKHILEIMRREQYNAKGGLQVPAVIPKPRLLAIAAKVED